MSYLISAAEKLVRHLGPLFRAELRERIARVDARMNARAPRAGKDK
jgi:hypothetical protein